MEIKQLSKQHGWEVSSGKLKWIISSLESDKTEYSVEKIARKSWKTAKKLTFFLNIPNILKFSKYLGNF